MESVPSWRWCHCSPCRLLAALRTSHERLSRSGPNGRLRCGRDAGLKPSTPRLSTTHSCNLLGLPLQVDPLHPTWLGRRRRVLEPLQRAPAGRGQCALALHLKASKCAGPLAISHWHEVAAVVCSTLYPAALSLDIPKRKSKVEPVSHNAQNIPHNYISLKTITLLTPFSQNATREYQNISSSAGHADRV